MKQLYDLCDSRTHAGMIRKPNVWVMTYVWVMTHKKRGTASWCRCFPFNPQSRSVSARQFRVCFPACSSGGRIDTLALAHCCTFLYAFMSLWGRGRKSDKWAENYARHELCAKSSSTVSSASQFFYVFADFHLMPPFPSGTPQYGAGRINVIMLTNKITFSRCVL